MTDSKIDIKKPGGSFLSPANTKLIGLAVGVMGLAAVGAYSYKTFFSSTTTTEDKTQLMVQAGIDPSYYTYEPDETDGAGSGYFAAEEFEEAETKAPLPTRENEPIIHEKIVYIEREPTRRPNADDLFRFEEKPKIDPRILAAQQINAARSGSLQVRVKITPAELEAQKKAAIQITNTQQDYDGVEGEIEASYPVDLSRVLTADRRITAVLENDIASELGGKITAIVMENVYAAHGNKILIPAGSKIIGSYKPLSKIGQERLEFIIPRIITPDGINIHLADGEISDAMGRSGITGKVNRRYLERYGMAFLVSLANAAVTYSIPVNSVNQQIVVENTGQEISTLSMAILEDHLNIKPQVNVPHGSIIHISAQKDIWFPKPVRKEVYAEAIQP